MIDPRSAVVGKRLAGIGRVIAVCAAKGGVGKTFCTATAAAVLARRGRRVGLLDLDLQGASAHVFLGVRPHMPDEREGILPLAAGNNLWLMGAAVFCGERALALRGPEVSDAILELLAVTQWGSLDYLFIDMPPGIGEEVLDLCRLVPRLEALAVSTPSFVAITVVERLVVMLGEMRVTILGLVANMVRGDAASVRQLAERTGIALLGEIPFDQEVEAALGSPDALSATHAAAALVRALERAGIT